MAKRESQFLLFLFTLFHEWARSRFLCQSSSPQAFITIKRWQGCAVSCSSRILFVLIIQATTYNLSPFTVSQLSSKHWRARLRFETPNRGLSQPHITRRAAPVPGRQAANRMQGCVRAKSSTGSRQSCTPASPEPQPFDLGQQGPFCHFYLEFVFKRSTCQRWAESCPIRYPMLTSLFIKGLISPTVLPSTKQATGKLI